jgi:hemolysin D
MFETISRHWNVLVQSWRWESERRKRSFAFSETDFLPAALEVMETPPSPVGRVVQWAIVSFLVIASVWSCVGRVDVVATATGQISPREQVKTIQSREFGTVRAIYVKNGQRVSTGDILIELDPTIAAADESQARRAVVNAQMSLARSRMLVAYLAGAAPDFDSFTNTNESLSASYRRLFESQISEYEAKRAALHELRSERRADLSVVEQQINKLVTTLPLIEEQVDARRPLVEQGLSPRLEFLGLQERLVAQQHDILIQKEQRRKMLAAIDASERQLDQITEEFRRQAVAEQTEAEQAIDVLGEDVKKASQRSALQRLSSPIDGIVQELAVYTIGGVVEPAQTLAVVVPTSGELIAEVLVLNKDIGFVKEGDEVEVKLEAFPFTRYGVVEGVVEHVSTDSIQHELLGLVYPGRVALKEQDIVVAGKSVRLSAGMAVTAEVKTDKRRIIQFLLSPLLRYRGESFRER